MRQIKIETWKSQLPVKDDEGNIVDSKEMDENLLMAFNVLIGSKNPKDIPKGIDAFRIFNKIAQAFDDAEKTGILKLEEREYDFLKETIENDVPSQWAMNPNLSQAIFAFINAKES